MRFCMHYITLFYAGQTQSLCIQRRDLTRWQTMRILQADGWQMAGRWLASGEKPLALGVVFLVGTDLLVFHRGEKQNREEPNI